MQKKKLSPKRKARSKPKAEDRFKRLYTKADMEAACELVRAASRKADQIATGKMVDRFLRWPLPDSVCSDLCVTQREWSKTGYPPRVGTNLLTADEARLMLQHIFAQEGPPIELKLVDERRIAQAAYEADCLENGIEPAKPR